MTRILEDKHGSEALFSEAIGLRKKSPLIRGHPFNPYHPRSIVFS
jgi:hypothetical protein